VTDFQQHAARQLARECMTAVRKGAKAAAAGDLDACDRHACDAAAVLRSAGRRGLFDATREELRRMTVPTTIAAE
jgi:hypothetical protein